MAERSYAYPAKETVRGEWMRFLPADLSTPQDHGLYLPGPENLELPGYLAKGMEPSRLVGAEHDPSRYAVIAKARSGIRLVNGSLLDAIYWCEGEGIPRLRVVNLDFDGNQHTFTEELLALSRVFPNRRGSYLGVTSYAARDHTALVQGVVNACKFYSGLPNGEAFVSGYGRMISRFSMLGQIFLRGESSEHAHVQRELGLLWWIVLMLAVIEPEEQAGPNVFDQTFVNELDAVLKGLTQEVEQDVATKALDRVVFIAKRALRDVLAERRVCWWVNDLRRLAYWSENHQPMRTWYFRIVPTAVRQQETAQTLLEQVWELSSRTPLIYVDEHGECNTIKDL